MYASLTSTSISSESMSTIVPIPVRVKPPPAENGETISPTWAALAITTPVNGARTVHGRGDRQGRPGGGDRLADRKSTRLNSSHEWISYAVFCLKKKKKE